MRKFLPDLGRPVLAAAILLFFAFSVPPLERSPRTGEMLVMFDWMWEITSIRPPEAAFATAGRANELADWRCGKIGFVIPSAAGGNLETRRTAQLKPAEMQAISDVLMELDESDHSISRVGPYRVSIRWGNESRYLDMGSEKSALDTLDRIGFHTSPAVREALSPLRNQLRARQMR